MGIVLRIENLTKSVGDRILFADVSLTVNEGDKIGVVARNGTGKSTLLNIICGAGSADSGDITWRSGVSVGLLEQNPEFGSAVTVIDAALEGGGPMAGVVKDYEAAMTSGDNAAIASAASAMDAAGAWNYQDKLRQLLSRLHLTDMDARLEHLSGGQRKRLALARTIMQDPDVIVLDEPTNHLDIDVIEWLENYLGRSRATLIMVTHDRYFLDRVCNRIWELDGHTAYSYEGNYDYFLRRRAERLEAMAADVTRARNLLRREQDWMSRQPQARAGKAKFRIDSYYELKERARGTAADRDIRLDTQASRIGSKIFEARGISKRFGDKVILDGFSYTFAPGEKVGIVGANGVGKSTFIKMLQGIVPHDSGEWNLGQTVRFGYYSQDGIAFDAGKKVIDAVTDIAEEIHTGTGSLSPMQWLQRFLFSVPDQQKYIATLSGGERCRLHLATVLMRQPNFLILDEPTNDLDIVTLGILEEYLSQFKGCAIVVSHDRYFLDNIVDHIFVMQGDGVVRDFPGNYSDWRQWSASQMREATRTPQPAPDKAAAEHRRTQRPAKLTFKERREMEALEAEIEALTAEKAELDALFASGGSADDITAKAGRYAVVTEQLDTAELRWLELSEKA